MPYSKSKNLPAQRSSYISHLDAIQDEPVLIEVLKLLKVNSQKPVGHDIRWENQYNSKYYDSIEPFKAIYCVDGSMQVLKDEDLPFKDVGVVKIALIRIDKTKLDKLDTDFPHPRQIKDILEENSFSISAIFPMKNVGFEGRNVSDSVRESIFKFATAPKYSGQLIETLKWIIFKKWLPEEQQLKDSEGFKCPYCNLGDRTAYIPHDSLYGKCECKESQEKPIFITDWFGFHGDMMEEYASDKVISAYMNVMETLNLMAAIHRLWESREKNNNAIKDCLFMKDGPLGLSSRYAKLNVYIRGFLNYAYSNGVPIHIVGQEKSGIFVDFFNAVKEKVNKNTFFIPDSQYIKYKIKCENTAEEYGRTTNYGWKILYCSKEERRYVLNIPVICNGFTNRYFHNPKPSASDVIGLHRILDSIDYLVSRKYENALYPIELAHGIASLSTYPSAKILKVFADEMING